MNTWLNSLSYIFLWTHTQMYTIRILFVRWFSCAAYAVAEFAIISSPCILHHHTWDYLIPFHVFFLSHSFNHTHVFIHIYLTLYLISFIKFGSDSIHLTASCFSHWATNVRNYSVSSERWVNSVLNLYLIFNGPIIYLFTFLLIIIYCVFFVKNNTAINLVYSHAYEFTLLFNEEGNPRIKLLR